MKNHGQNEKIDVSKSFVFRIYNMFYLRAASKSIRRLKLFKKASFEASTHTLGRAYTDTGHKFAENRDFSRSFLRCKKLIR